MKYKVEITMGAMVELTRDYVTQEIKRKLFRKGVHIAPIALEVEVIDSNELIKPKVLKVGNNEK